MSVNRADHAAIRVTDLGQALEWYEGVLGLKLCLAMQTQRFSHAPARLPT